MAEVTWIDDGTMVILQKGNEVLNATTILCDIWEDLWGSHTSILYTLEWYS